MAEVLIASRLVHFAAMMILLGSSLFPLYAIALPDTAAADGVIAVLDRRLHRWLTVAAVVALLSGLGWLLSEAGTMSDDPAASIDPATIRTVLFDTGFGRVWQLQLAVGLLLLLLLLVVRPRSHRRRRGRLAGVASVAAVLIASQAWVGHADIGTGLVGDLRLANQVLHLGAGALWLGGLPPLSLMLAQARSRGAIGGQALALAALPRFSRIGFIAVGVLVATGLVNSWFVVGGVEGLVGTPYGRLLMLKVALFLAMVGFALANRLILLPRAVVRQAAAASAELQLAALRRNVVLEQLLGLLVIATVSVFATLPPAVVVGN
jgi:copper resistance protein D